MAQGAVWIRFNAMKPTARAALENGAAPARSNRAKSGSG